MTAAVSVSPATVTGPTSKPAGSTIRLPAAAPAAVTVTTTVSPRENSGRVTASPLGRVQVTLPSGGRSPPGAGSAFSEHRHQNGASERTMRRHEQLSGSPAMPFASSVITASATHGSSGQGGQAGIGPRPGPMSGGSPRWLFGQPSRMPIS